jgi:hypothetical protein
MVKQMAVKGPQPAQRPASQRASAIGTRSIRRFCPTADMSREQPAIVPDIFHRYPHDDYFV